ncbi:chromosome segregation protein SMC, partial [Geodermatophilus sp. DF01-2]
GAVDLPGVLGPVAERITVAPGAEVPVAAALAGLADALVVDTVAEAAAALAHLKDVDGGRAGLLVPGGLPALPRDGWPQLPEGVRWALDLVTAPDELCPALARVLDRVAVVPGLDAAVALVRTHPRVRAVTADGDLVGADWSVGGQANAPSGLEVRARVDDADRELAAAAARAAELADRLAAARETARERSADV